MTHMNVAYIGFDCCNGKVVVQDEYKSSFLIAEIIPRVLLIITEQFLLRIIQSSFIPLYLK